MNKVYFISEIGINHSGDMSICKELILQAKNCGSNAVKFQKRIVEETYSPEFLASPRNDGNPYGWKTQGEQKFGIEFNFDQYCEINDYCSKIGIDWSASAWSENAFLFLKQFDLPFHKVASALINNENFLNLVAKDGKYTYISTGMASWEEIDKAVEIFRKHNCPFEIMYTVSTYPMPLELANLSMINTLKNRYGVGKIGWSDHSQGRVLSLAAVGMGITSLERHITLNRASYGSDQAASLEIADLQRLILDVRGLEVAMGTGERILSEAELEVRKKLRGN